MPNILHDEYTMVQTMPTIRLTEQEIKKAQYTGGQRTEYWFEGKSGLVLRCYPSGRRTWSFDFQPVVNGKRENRTEKVGDASVLKLDDVRKRWHELASRDKVELAKELDALSVRPAVYTVADLANDWLRRHVHRKLRPNTVREYEYRMKAYILPELEAVPAEHLRKRDVIRVIDNIAEEGKRGEGAPVLADRVKAIISSMYRWAQREDRLKHNPAQLVDNRASAHWRERVLNNCEIPIFWSGLDAAPIEHAMRNCSPPAAL